MLFEELVVAAQDPSARAIDHYLSKMHVLAEARYMEAFPFLVQLLNDSRSDWVEHAILAIGFHYRFDPVGAEVKTIQQLLTHHSDDFVRLAAASVLGGRSRWPDNYLMKALNEDENDIVRKSAFWSLLELAEIPYPEIRQIEERLEQSDVKHDLQQLKQVLEEHGKGHLLNDIHEF